MSAFLEKCENILVCVCLCVSFCFCVVYSAFIRRSMNWLNDVTNILNLHSVILFFIKSKQLWSENNAYFFRQANNQHPMEEPPETGKIYINKRSRINLKLIFFVIVSTLIYIVFVFFGNIALHWLSKSRFYRIRMPETNWY